MAAELRLLLGLWHPTLQVRGMPVSVSRTASQTLPDSPSCLPGLADTCRAVTRRAGQRNEDTTLWSCGDTRLRRYETAEIRDCRDTRLRRLSHGTLGAALPNISIAGREPLEEVSDILYQVLPIVVRLDRFHPGPGSNPPTLGVGGNRPK